MNASDPKQIFLQEAQELLEQLEQTLLDLDRTPGDGELIDTAFRSLHTIKGSGAMFGFDAVAAFTHHVETAFDLVRKGKLTPTRELFAVALAAKDQMRRLIDHPETASASAGDAILLDLQRCIETDMASPSGPRSGGGTRETGGEREDPDHGEPDPAEPFRNDQNEREVVWRIRFRLPADAMLTGTNPLLLLDELRTFGQASIVALTDDVPGLEAMEPTLLYLRWEVILRTDQPRSAIEQVFLFVLDEMELEIERIMGNVNAAAGGGVTPADARPVPPARDEQAAKSNDNRRPTAAPPPAAPRSPGGDTREAKIADTIRVPAERLDELMDRVGQLVIAQSRLKEIAAASKDAAMKSVTEDIERLSLELRDTTMGVRMLPIGQLFSRFRRLIHDRAGSRQEDRTGHPWRGNRGRQDGHRAA
jgi:two-component system, chemotaxis family, sensor kinase CheA